MTDLFQAAAIAARPAPKAATGLDALQPSGRFEKWRGSTHFVHHCAKCGDVHAPFGFRCLPNPRNGIWLCRACRDEVLAEEGSA